MADLDPRVTEALRRVRSIAEAQRPALNLPDRQLDPDLLQRFADDLPEEIPESRLEVLRSEIDALSPWLQGPFYLGGDLVIEGLWRIDGRWAELSAHVPELGGKRVLDVGCNAGYDPFMFRVLGAAEVVACEPYEFIAQARFLESIYRSGVQFEEIGWQELDPNVHGEFDLIHCNGVLYHEPHPLAMLQRLRSMLAPNGQLLLGSMMLASAELSEHVRFVRHDYAGDPSWWWVPGRLALRWMMDACGLDCEPLPIRFSALAGSFEVINGYLRAVRSEPDPQLTGPRATRPSADDPPASNGPVNRFPIGHYYSPMYDTRELDAQRERLWPSGPPRETVGIDWCEQGQLELCSVFGRLDKFDFADHPSADPTEYYASNDQYPPLDAWVLAGILEHFATGRMIEIGCGFSTLIGARTNRERLAMNMRLTCIEPHPREFLLAGVPGVSDLRVEKIQETPVDLFAELTAGDVLFIDTSHTVKTGGDVNWIFFELIPRVAPGVLVHIHDVFIPGEYPEPWVMAGWGWNESYLVRAFLSFNEQFEILWGAQYMLHRHLDTVKAAFPGLNKYVPSGGSLWIQRRSS